MAETKLDVDTELEEFRAMRGDASQRNQDFWLLRQAFQGLFRWPDAWPAHKPKLRIPLIRKMALVHAALLMGKGFNTDIEPLDDSESALKAVGLAEKGIDHNLATGGGRMHLNRAAVLGSLLGVSGFKTFQDAVGPSGVPVAAFNAIQPELFYPVTRGDDYMSLVKVFYAYSIDRIQAGQLYKEDAEKFLSEREVEDRFKGPPVAGSRLDTTGTDGQRYLVTGNYAGSVSTQVQERRIPVLEVWTDSSYALWVGGEEIENGPNPYDFIPFTAIPNIDAGLGIFGESDVDQILEINEELNQVISHMAYIEKRFMNPTYLWQVPPENYVDLATRIAGGGGVIPLYGRSDVKLLEIPQLPAEYGELVDRLRIYGVELSGLSELAFSGEAGGSVNTGASLTVNFTNVLATLGLKQVNWTVGLQRLLSQLLYHLESMKEIGVVPDSSVKSTAGGKSGMVKLTGQDIKGHRRVTVTWPGVLPRDDVGAAQLVIQQVQAGIKSRRTGMEELGVRYPEDELKRIEEEQENPALNPEGTATRQRADAATLEAQTNAQAAQAPPAEGEAAPGEDDLASLNETPVGFGTGPDGQVRNAEGRTLPQDEADLVRFQARQQRLTQGQPEPGAPPA